MGKGLGGQKYLNRLEKESGRLYDSYDKLKQNFAVYYSQFDHNIVIDNNADGSFDPKQRDSMLYTPNVGSETPLE